MSVLKRYKLYNRLIYIKQLKTKKNLPFFSMNESFEDRDQKIKNPIKKSDELG